MIEQHAIDWTIPWREEAREEGRQEGEAASVRKGEAAVLLRQFRLKFGPLDPVVEERVKNADAARLLEWGERFVSAATLDEVFDGNGH